MQVPVYFLCTILSSQSVPRFVQGYYSITIIRRWNVGLSFESLYQSQDTFDDDDRTYVNMGKPFSEIWPFASLGVSKAKLCVRERAILLGGFRVFKSAKLGL